VLHRLKSQGKTRTTALAAAILALPVVWLVGGLGSAGARPATKAPGRARDAFERTDPG
jgi:hypothetical protein